MTEDVKRALSVIAQVKKAVMGKDACIIKTMTAILAGGHVLIEDIPGVGKTTLALAFYHLIFHLQKRDKFFCLSAGSGNVQSLSGGRD